MRGLSSSNPPGGAALSVSMSVGLACIVAACGGKSTEEHEETSADATSTVPTGSQCPGVIEIQRAYFAETTSLESSVKQEVDNPSAQSGPCSECTSTCSVLTHAGCDAHDNCVERNCDCATTGCPNGIAGDDFCSCAATCTGPRQKVCLQPWIDFGRCLAEACAGVCP